MKNGNGLALALAVLLVASACTDTPRRDETSEPGQPQARQTAGPDDALIATTIQAKYYRAKAVKGHRISVDSENGVVTLRGRVDTETARQQAVALAKGTTGVSQVAEQLTVTADADGTIARSTQPDAQSPGWITAKIQAQYYMHPGLKPWNIDVIASPNGKVTLAGVIDNAADRAEAVKIARGTDGVVDVTDSLRVRGEMAAITGSSDPTLERITDSSITAKIQSRYFVDDDVKGRNIDVATKDGVVTLSGTVNSSGERLQAAAIARNTDGVEAVNDELMIDPQPRKAQVSGSVKGSVGTAGRMQDAWITTKIQSTFFLDDRIRARNIGVDTKNGVVTLKGTVATEDARKAAESLAMESDGVLRVVNQLSVDPGVT